MIKDSNSNSIRCYSNTQDRTWLSNFRLHITISEKPSMNPSTTDVENVDPLPPNDANDARWPGSWSVLEKFKKKAAWKLLPVVNLTALCMSFGELWNLEITRANKQTLFRNFQYNLNHFVVHCRLESHFIIGPGIYKILKFRLYWNSMQKGDRV